ncbi:MipA/OmpV family protein [Pseudomonas sp. ADAK13]|uniref:MipA/OmpV family protein n=1 Tax=Pseudomonas sp. ADAK13 TaxID=2730847 RepID=UPI00146358AB|nr:MipA/OmpV family protein [Pseudomonas sp. ADAK13]QJI37059.1 MipA/OmpV family protein [Pseudomonas sp. ADAK13]
MKSHTASPASHLGIIKTLVICTSLIALPPGHLLAAEESASQSLWGDKTDITLGLGAAVTPRFMGANHYRSVLLPTLSIQRGIFFADSLRGLGVQWQSHSGFAASAAFNYDMGRSTKNNGIRYGSSELKGMGTVGGATVADINLSQQLLPWLSINGEAELRTGGEHRGNRYRLSVEGLVFHGSADTVTLDVDAHAGDGRYNQTYFGVSQEQSQTASFKRFNSDAGIYAYSAALSWQHTFDNHWSGVISAVVTQYTDQAHDSPLVQTETGAMGLAAINYSF